MYGAGQNAIRKLFPNATLLHCELNPSFKNQPPEPLNKNLQELANLVKVNEDVNMGLATDGDADRLGIYDEKGNFIDSHHLILLLVHYLHKYKQMKGSVVISFACSDKIKKLCDIHGLPYKITKIGFKYICELMTQEDVLIGGEESGGIAVKGHMPERDGIWNGMLLLEFMAKTGKSLSELLQEIYDMVGPFAFERDDLHIEERLKQKIIANCKKKVYKKFGQYTVKKVEDMDGYKFYLGQEQWVMIRPSGTEPILRVYAEAANKKQVLDILNATKTTLLG